MKLLSLFALLLIAIFSMPALAEPYLAVRTGQKCMSCHVNPTGGGKRNDAGSIFGQHVLPARSVVDAWNGRVSPYLALGGDLRGNLNVVDRAGTGTLSEFETQRVSLYLEITPVPDVLTLYVDELLSPAASNREAYALLWNQQRDFYLKAGRIFLPYGLRIEDDTAFIRSATGINFSNADNGIEAGYEGGRWSINTALSNGSNGGDELNNAKQLSLRLAHHRQGWQSGASINLNDGPGGSDRNMYNLFAGVKWQGMEWLAELDVIQDEGTTAGTIERRAALVEANRLLSKGHNLKLTLEYYDPDTAISENQQNRSSLVWEYTPLSLLQLRVGLRMAEGIPQAVDGQNDDLLFVQLHSWF